MNNYFDFYNQVFDFNLYLSRIKENMTCLITEKIKRNAVF